MKITPLDIRSQTFRTVFRGADNQEVRVFLDLVATEFESLLQESMQLSERLHHCEDRLAEYRSMDQSLRDGVLTAERLASEARESSKREASLVVQDAELRAERILDDARNRMARIAEEIRDLQTKRDIYVEQMRSFLRSHMEMLERNEQYLQGLDRVGEDATTMLSRTRRTEGRSAPPSSPPPRGVPRPAAPASPEAVPSETPPPVAGRPSPNLSGAALRGLGRFNRLAGPSQPGEASGERSVPGPSEPRSEPQHGPGPERDEGLFEISSEEEDPPGSP